MGIIVEHYARCRYCGREMKPNTGCKIKHFKLDGKLYARDLSNLGQQGTCHDCNAPLGEPHHPGCDNERCPKCGGQLLACGCMDKALLVFS